MYEPAASLSCPTCQDGLSDRWLGSSGPNRLLVWQEGAAGPVCTVDDGEVLAARGGSLSDFRLPSAFVLQASCGSGHRVLAVGEAPEGVWSSTRLVVDEAEHNKLLEEALRSR